MEQQGGISLPLSDGSLSPENTQPCSPDRENVDKLLVHIPYAIPELVKADLYVV